MSDTPAGTPQPAATTGGAMLRQAREAPGPAPSRCWRRRSRCRSASSKRSRSRPLDELPDATFARAGADRVPHAEDRSGAGAGACRSRRPPPGAGGRRHQRAVPRAPGVAPSADRPVGAGATVWRARRCCWPRAETSCRPGMGVAPQGRQAPSRAPAVADRRPAPCRPRAARRRPGRRRRPTTAAPAPRCADRPRPPPPPRHRRRRRPCRARARESWVEVPPAKPARARASCPSRRRRSARRRGAAVDRSAMPRRRRANFRGQPVTTERGHARDNVARAEPEVTSSKHERPSQTEPANRSRMIASNRRPAPPVRTRPRVVWGSRRSTTVGGDAPVRVQSMTNTDTVDVIGPPSRSRSWRSPAPELVRITVNTPEAAQAVPHIREQLDRMGIDVPLVGDFHYNGHRLLTEFRPVPRRSVEVPHQPRQRRQGRQARPPVRPDGRGRRRSTTRRCASASTGAA